MKSMLFVAMLLCLVSCFGGGSGGSSSSGPSVRSVTFTDSTVTNFTQTQGVASLEKRWYQYVIEYAYADSGSIRCLDGNPVEFDMDITLGGVTSPLNVEAECGSDVELQIRREMLAALDNHKMILEVAGSGSVGPDYTLDFTQAEGFAFDTPYVTLEDEKTFAALTQDCYIDYTFNSATGTVSSNISTTILAGRAKGLNETANTNWGIANPWQPDSGNGYTGCKSTDGEYRTADFRFKDGKIELDESGTKRFSANGCASRNADESIDEYRENGDGAGNCPDAGFDSTYERWCIDDDLNGVCD